MRRLPAAECGSAAGESEVGWRLSMEPINVKLVRFTMCTTHLQGCSSTDGTLRPVAAWLIETPLIWRPKYPEAILSPTQICTSKVALSFELAGTSWDVSHLPPKMGLPADPAGKYACLSLASLTGR